MTVIETYTAECVKCGYKELRMGLMSFNTMVEVPDDLMEQYPVGCPECGDVSFDVYDVYDVYDEDDEDDDEDG